MLDVQLGGVFEEENAMRAVMPEVLPQIARLAEADRQRQVRRNVGRSSAHGASAKRSHQDIIMDMCMWLRSHWARPRGNRVHHDVNVTSPGGWPNDYRVPDLVLLTPDRFAHRP